MYYSTSDKVWNYFQGGRKSEVGERKEEKRKKKEEREGRDGRKWRETRRGRRRREGGEGGEGREGSEGETVQPQTIAALRFSFLFILKHLPVFFSYSFIFNS